MNYRGITLVETLLTVVILFTIACSIVPISYHMYNSLYNKKLELYASETAYMAAKIILYEERFAGENKIENENFSWQFDGHTLCVEFNNLNGERKKCISQFGEIE